jgi:hypothetical protein
MMKDEYLRDFFAALALDGIMSKTASMRRTADKAHQSIPNCTKRSHAPDA